MPKQECTDVFVTYREIARLIWNLGFWPKQTLHEIDAIELYQTVAATLFEGMVLFPCGYRGPAEDKWYPGTAADIYVEPAHSNVRLMVNKHSPGEPGQIWGHPTLTLSPGLQDLKFLAFFDWDQRAPREMQFVEVRIERMEQHPDLVGRHAIVEFNRCSIWLENR